MKDLSKLSKPPCDERVTRKIWCLVTDGFTVEQLEEGIGLL